MFDPGENDGTNQISSTSLILSGPPRFARAPTHLGLLVLPLGPLLEDVPNWRNSAAAPSWPVDVAFVP